MDRRQVSDRWRSARSPAGFWAAARQRRRERDRLHHAGHGPAVLARRRQRRRQDRHGGGLQLFGAGFAQQRTDPAPERAGCHRPRRRRHRHLADGFLDRSGACWRWPSATTCPSSSPTSATNSGDYVSLIKSEQLQGAPMGSGEAAGRGAEGQGLGEGRVRPLHDLARPQERAGPHRRLPATP